MHEELREMGLRPSMSSVGDALDNALCESWLATLESELIERRSLLTQAAARMAILRQTTGQESVLLEGVCIPCQEQSGHGRTAGEP